MRTSALVLLAASALLLTGCGVAVPVETVTVTATPSPTATASGPLSGSPVGTTCDDLVPPPVMQSMHPGYTIDAKHVDDEGEWQDIKNMGGVVCSWGDGGAQGDLVLGYAHPDAASLATIKAKFAADSTYAQNDAFGNPPEIIGYFGQLGGVPDAEVFIGGYWITVSSNLFASADDVIPIINSVNQVIPQA